MRSLGRGVKRVGGEGGEEGWEGGEEGWAGG